MNSDRALIRASPVAYEILVYLGQHCEAEDTWEGVVQWWLWERAVPCSTREVKAALAALVAQGWVRARTGGDARTYYRMNPRRRGEIRALIQPRPPD